MPLDAQLQEIQSRIRKAAAGCGRSAESVELVAVSKTFTVDAVRAAYDLGLRDFGENRVQELLAKQPDLPADVRWHMIGRLQTNKVKDLIGKVALIHSLDRDEIFEKIDGEARKKKISEVACLVQVNVSGESTKAGFRPEQIADFLKRVPEDSPVRIQGLMTMGPLTEDRAEIRRVFKATKELFDALVKQFPKLQWRHLSMGMSSDFEIAVEEGATMVRIGTALFGARN